MFPLWSSSRDSISLRRHLPTRPTFTSSYPSPKHYWIRWLRREGGIVLKRGLSWVGATSWRGEGRKRRSVWYGLCSWKRLERWGRGRKLWREYYNFWIRVFLWCLGPLVCESLFSHFSCLVLVSKLHHCDESFIFSLIVERDAKPFANRRRTFKLLFYHFPLTPREWPNYVNHVHLLPPYPIHPSNLELELDQSFQLHHRFNKLLLHLQ